MPSWEAITVVVLAGLALSASPGPSMLYVLSRTLQQGRMAGLASSVGLALGGILLAVISALGLAALFIYSTTAYSILRILGGCYLLYLGARMLMPSRGGDDDTNEVIAPPRATFGKIVVQGMLVELLNPKTILFFLAYLPQFVDPRRPSVTMQMLVLGILVPLTAIPSDIVVTLSGSALAHKLAQKPKAGKVLERLGGLVLIALGVRILFF